MKHLEQIKQDNAKPVIGKQKSPEQVRSEARDSLHRSQGPSDTPVYE